MRKMFTPRFCFNRAPFILDIRTCCTVLIGNTNMTTDTFHFNLLSAYFNTKSSTHYLPSCLAAIFQKVN